VLEQTEALGLSIVVETTCLLGLGRARGWMTRPAMLGWVLAGVAVTLVTHPFAWDASITHTPELSPEGKALRIEGAVVLAEALLYAVSLRLTPLRAFAASLLANASSFAVGLLLM